MTSRVRTLAAVAILSFTGAAAMAAAADGNPLVLTATQATYSLTSALAAGTPIEVRNVPADARQFPMLKDYMQRRMNELAPVFSAATAVVSLTNALPSDPLYRLAREANVRVVDIDAALPWGFDMPGVALTATPLSNVPWAGEAEAPDSAPAPYFWLSVSNAVRMADIIAHDLSALFPESAAVIARNRGALRRSLLALREDFHRQPVREDADVVFALTGDFVYLTNDLGLLVDGYFIRQDVSWTQADLAALTRHLRERNITIVLHRWQPSEAIQTAISAAGARLIVLDPGDPGVIVDGQLARDGLQQILRSNLAAISTAQAAE